jgi:Gram-negative bacterial TonB protein C-terminal
MAQPGTAVTAEPACVWSDGSHTFAIHLQPSVLRRLTAETKMALKMVPRRGLEIGGILLGRADSQDSRTDFWIEGFQAVESEHRTGPSYVLSETDFTRLKDELGKNGAASIGVYRSHTRAEALEVQQPDIELLDRCFGTQPAVFLMLAPASSTAALFLRTNGVLKNVHQLTLESSFAALSEERPANPARRGPPPLPEGPPGRLRKLGLPPLPSPRALVLKGDAGLKHRATMFAAALLVIVLAGTAITLLSIGSRPTAVVQQNPIYLPLTVERDGPSVKLLWDRTSPLVKNATRAVIHIQDGGFQSDGDLTPSQFGAGSFLYKPKGSEVTFRLDVYSADANGTGSIQIVNWLAPEKASAKSEPPAEAPERTRTIAKATLPEAPRPETREIDKPVTRAIPPPPELPATVVSSPDIPKSVPPPEPPAAIPSVRGPSLQIVTEPVPRSRWSRTVSKIPLVRRLRKPEKTVVAVPVHRAEPSLSATDKQSVVRPVSVDVKVFVAESGKVNGAEVVGYGDPPQWGLANAALSAARRWTFEPARIDDVPVASEMMMHFRFRP